MSDKRLPDCPPCRASIVRGVTSSQVHFTCPRNWRISAAGVAELAALLPSVADDSPHLSRSWNVTAGGAWVFTRPRLAEFVQALVQDTIDHHLESAEEPTMSDLFPDSPSQPWTGWTRCTPGRWQRACEAESEAACWSALLDRPLPCKMGDRTVLPSGADPNRRARPRKA